jgi:Ca-activated chloride channel family protein
MKGSFLFIALFILSIQCFAHPFKTTITGKITDEQGLPVAFASITEEGTKNVTSSAQDGSYTFIINIGQYIIVSCVGYETQKLLINGRTVINVGLVRSRSMLQEVVVTGLAISRKTSSMGYSAMYGSRSNDNYNTEGYASISENDFHRVGDEPLSTFSIDVDAASYSNVRRFLHNKQLPPAGAVRVEEMINYFSYQYPEPKDEKPLSISTEFSGCPWNKQHKILMVGLQGKRIALDKLPPSNLVFLIDVSGSMQDENKLPLVQSSLKMLTDNLRAEDRISIVVYAGNAGLVLPATSGADKEIIKKAIDGLSAGGSTAGGQGIQLAYKIAFENKLEKGNNRVILCTDGDFNVGASSNDEMSGLIETEREKGIFLTVLGYGMGNYKDDKMQELADKGNGNHAYIDGIAEAKKVLISEFGGTLFTIAKDVKLQVEFNPAKISGYRLIGYENRMLAKEDFKNDKKDAGDLGSGHTVTALYEVIPTGNMMPFTSPVDPLRYRDEYDEEAFRGKFSNELLTIKVRYKEPDGNSSKLLVQSVKEKAISFAKASDNLRFATAVAGFGLLLRNSSFKGNSTYNSILSIASQALGTDKEGYRKEFVSLVETANELSAKAPLAVVTTDE